MAATPPAPPPLHNGGFAHILNFRDVGATVNAHLGRPLLRPGLLFRAARLDAASPADRARLRDVHRVRTVVDLRSAAERAQAAALAVPVPITGLDYREVQVTGRAFERHMLAQLGWRSYAKLIALHLAGYRMRAIAVLGREVMVPRGLLGLAAATLDVSGPEVAAGLRCLLLQPPSRAAAAAAAAAALPVLYHCTQGKDRTGLLVALALLVCGAPVAAVEHDYALSDAALLAAAGGAAARVAELRAMGLGAEFGRTAEGFVRGVVAHLEARYGGLDKYLDAQGFGEEERAGVRKALLCVEGGGQT